MKRYVRIYLFFLQMSWSAMLSYRASFISGVISSLVWSSFHIIAILLLTARQSSVFGWTREELILISGASQILLGIFYFICSRNFREFPEIVNKGKLDGLLVKPIDAQFFISFQYATYYSLTRFIVGLGVFFFVLSRIPLHIGPLQVLGFLLLLLFGFFLQYAVWFSIMTLTIWFTTLSNLLDLLFNMNDLARFPQEMYRGAREAVYLLVFPFTLILIVPVRAILQKVTFSDIAWLIGISMIFFLSSRKLFYFALRSYTSAGG